MHRTILAVALCLPLSAQTKLPPSATMKIDFDQHVKPILTASCYSCHGPRVQQSGLRLDKRQNALRGGDYGPVINPGNSASSKLILRLVSGDGGMQMPPTGALPAEDIGILRAWIDQGAEFGKVEVKEDAPPKPVDPKLTSLITAVRSQDLRMVKAALKVDPSLVKAQDNSGATALHHAAGFGNTAVIAFLLDQGADVKARNRRGATPLHWATPSEEKVRLLLDRGAEIDAKQAEGRTPLYQAASMSNHLSVLRLLLDRGADAGAATVTGTTPLSAAAARGDVDAMRMLIAKGAKVNTRNGTGATPLYAASLSGNPEAVRFLLDREADVNALTKRQQSALSGAAMHGTEGSVRFLLDRGAKVNVQDDRGYSPLMYAAYSEVMPVGIVKSLLAKGADQGVTGEGETAKTLAAKRGDSEVARLLNVPEDQRKRGGTAPLRAPAGERSAAEAVQKALALLEKQSHNFIRIGGCNSCHNQFLPSAAVALARQRGIVAPKVIPQLSREMREVSADRAMDLGVVSVNSIGYEVFDLGMNRAPKDEYTDAIARYLRAMQSPDGSWRTTAVRPPLTSDDIQTTAFAIYALRQFAPAVEKPEVEKVIAKAADWLEKSKPMTTQERAFQLLGLTWANASASSIDRSAKALAAAQRADGGWNQLPSMGSDAYAAGQALYALNASGKVAVGSTVYQSGVKYLLQTQAADGSWRVKTRALPVQPYFESGYPYHHDQWISAAGSSWAAMALSMTVEPSKITRNESRNKAE
jgi:ankyrin repeat protein